MHTKQTYAGGVAIKYKLLYILSGSEQVRRNDRCEQSEQVVGWNEATQK